MRERGIKVYENVIKQRRIKFDIDPKSIFSFSFSYGPRIDIIGGNSEYEIKFKIKGETNYHYIGKNSKGTYIELYRRWFTPWIIECYDEDRLIYTWDFEESLYNSKICVSIDSSSLGDTLAWIPVISKLILKYNCDLYVTSFWNHLLSLFYPDIRFKLPGTREPNTVAIFGVGWYDEKDIFKHKRDPRTISLQQVAGDHLGINVLGDITNENIPDFIKNSKSRIDKPYVCLAMRSTANSKHWHYPDGWQIIVDYLNSIGYTTVVIQKQECELNNIINKTGDVSIHERAIDIYHADFIIGIGSGLSWLAWFLNKPVIMISGFSLPYCEFVNKNYRIINSKVCHGCFNDPLYKFDRGDWNWCPRLKETPNIFECTKNITPEIVKLSIKDLILNEKLKSGILD